MSTATPFSTSRRASARSTSVTRRRRWSPRSAEQAGDLIHLCAIVGSYEPYIALAEKLNELVPIAGPKKTFLSNSGAEAVETAIKMARAYTGRPAHRHLRRRVSRAHAADALADEQVRALQEGFRPLCAGNLPRALSLRLSLPALPQRRRLQPDLLRGSGAGADHAGRPGRIGGGADHRAGAGRGRLHPRLLRVSAQGARPVRQARHRADRRRGAGRLLPHRALVLLSSTAASSRTWW
jgi:hypothetical protein